MWLGHHRMFSGILAVVKKQTFVHGFLRHSVQVCASCVCGAVRRRRGSAHCCSTIHGEQQYVSDGGTLVSKGEPAGTFRK